MTIITYGGGYILFNIFNSIAMLMNGKTGSLFQPLMVLAATTGGIWALSKAFFSQSIEYIFSRYFMPILVIGGIFFIPTSTVLIEDVIEKKGYKVDHVPYLLAQFATMTSSIGYKITCALESVMHTPNDTQYNKTGMLFGGDTSLETSQFKITNGDLNRNLKTFVNQCVFYDLALEKYSVEEIQKSTNLWKLFEEKTSKVRLMPYFDPEKPAKDGSKCSYCSCSEAIKKMLPYFEKEKRYYLQHDVLKNLPLTFQALSGLQQNSNEVIGQQIMLNSLDGELGSQKFASERAYIQQRNTYQILGSLASKGLVTMRGVIEALIYAAFLFVMPLTMLPGGIKFLSIWASQVIWIQLWPPFFAILSYIMQIVAQAKATSMFSGLSADQLGLSYFTSIGIENLQADVFAMAGYLSASIPFITYSLLKGGISSFVHLSSSLMSPAHSASSTAAGELTSGNYSFSNASMAQMHYGNTSAFQKNTAPSLSSGFSVENRGYSSITHTPKESLIRQGNSELRSSVMSDESIQSSFQNSEQNARSVVATTQEQFIESASMHGKQLTSLTDHLSRSIGSSETFTNREASDIHDSVRHISSEAENWGKQYGLNQRESIEVLGAAGASGGTGLNIGFIRFGADIEGKLSGHRQSSRDDILSSALNVSSSKDFQNSIQKLQDYSKSETANFGDDQGVRLANDFSHSFDTMKNKQELFQTAQSDLTQLSQTKAWSESNSSLIRRSYNQEFVNWASEQYRDKGGYNHAFEILTRSDFDTEKNQLLTSFAQYARQKEGTFASPTTPQKGGDVMDYTYRSNTSKMETLDRTDYLKNRETLMNAGEEKGLFLDLASRRSDKISQKNERARTNIEKDVEGPTKNDITETNASLSKQFKRRDEQYLVTKMIKGAEIPKWIEEGDNDKLDVDWKKNNR